MNEITLGQIWLKAFHLFGAIRLIDLVWVFNVIMSGVLLHCKGFWKALGYFNLIVGGLYLLLRIIQNL